MPTLVERLLLHGSTQSSIDAYLSDPSHAVLLVGPVGGGKRTLMEYLAAQLGGGTPDKRIWIDSDTNTLKIEQIRNLRDQLKLRAVADENRVVLIPDASRLTQEAQNSLLKYLEEPPANSFFILSVSDKSKLLTTVVSRCAVLDVRPVSKVVFTKYAAERGYSEAEAAKAYAVSEGAVGMALSLLNGDASLESALDSAKELLKTDMLGRLKRVDALSKKKDELPELLFGLERVLLVGMHTANEKGQKTEAWETKLRAVERAETALRHNVTTRLLLTDLMLNI